MLLALDVDYRDDGSAAAAGILFSGWTSGIVEHTVIRRIATVAAYRPGHFFERELPCLLAVLEALGQPPETILVDGYVFLGADRHDGLGAHLFHSLQRATPVIGVAKNRFRDTLPETEVHRGNGRRPLYVTSIGLDETLARERVRTMHGPHRIPTILAAADRACRTA